ncbi:hypothetical protein Q7O_002999 [Pectobacterium carotovorum subsp. carotovorum PCCS1]|nr:hypothetical protein [Pectobacterium carotovorum subsp. carotovorum PCCS1]
MNDLQFFALYCLIRNIYEFLRFSLVWRRKIKIFYIFDNFNLCFPV